MTGKALELQGISKHFGALKAVDGVTLDVAEGERRAVIGPNGAGKTTLFHVLSGMQRPTAGRILLFGQDVTALPMHRRIARGLARTFQITNLFAKLTVEENIALALGGPIRFSMLRPRSAYRELSATGQDLLDRWCLLEKRGMPVHELSYGEQRALEIILAVAQRPRLLLLDEPTAGLSPAETASAAALIRALPREMAIVLIEHDMDVVFDLCDSMSVLHLGKLLATGDPAHVRADRAVQEIYLGAASA